MSTNTPLTPSPAPQPQKRKVKPRAFSDLLRDWESLLAATGDHAADLAPVEPHRAALADTLEKARQAKALQDSHKATKQTTTQTLKSIITEGEDRARRLRGAIRAEMGTTTEQLTQFGIPPIRRRPARHQPDTPTPKPAPQPELQAAKAAQEAK